MEPPQKNPASRSEPRDGSQRHSPRKAAIEHHIAKHKIQGKLIALKRNIQTAANRTASPIASNDISKAQLLVRSTGTLQFNVYFPFLLRRRYKRQRPFHFDAKSGQMFCKNALRLRLWNASSNLPDQLPQLEHRS